MRCRTNRFFAAVILLLFFFSLIFTRASAASDLDKIYDLLTRPPKKNAPAKKNDAKGRGVPQLFQIFNQQTKAARNPAKKKTKGYLNEALKDVDLGREIESKTIVLEKKLEKVILKIRAYQAMNGAIWLTLGKSYNSLVGDLKNLEGKGSVGVDEFIRQTKVKQNQQLELIGHVTLDASAGLSDSSETIELNHRKNQKLREAVKYMIHQNPIVSCAFGDVINQQNKALDSLLRSYMKRLSQVTRLQMTASEIFQNISREFKAAESEMREAIAVFNEQSALVSLQAAEHMDILYAQARDLKKVTNTATGGGDLYTALTVLPKVPPLIKEINRLTGVYNNFQKVRDKLARESGRINHLCAASCSEIEQSSYDLEQIRARINRMWGRQVDEIREISRKRRVQVEDLEGLLKKEEKKNKLLASRRSKDQEHKIRELANKTFGEPVFD